MRIQRLQGTEGRVVCLVNIFLNLPKPPSINHIYGYTSSGKFARSYITKKGKQWFNDAIEEIAKQTSSEHNKFPISEKVLVSVDLYTCRMQDIDNIFKPILDVISVVCLNCHKKTSRRGECDCPIEKVTLLKDDNLVYKLVATKNKVKKVTEEKVEVEITYL